MMVDGSSKVKSNQDLQALYERAYQDGRPYGGENSYFTFPTLDITAFVVDHLDVKDKTVLEVGCGTGDTAAAIAKSGAKSVLGIDYAQESIKTCKTKYTMPNLAFKVDALENITDHYDLIVLQEVIEHVDAPEKTILFLMTRLNPGGKLVLTCPNFSNLRGYIWMTLQLLLDVPMSLSDLHFFSPFDFMDIAKRNGLSLVWQTFAHDRVYGEKLIVDFDKRLRNALRDAQLDTSKVDIFLDWLKKVVTLDHQPTPINGGKGFYVFTHAS